MTTTYQIEHTDAEWRELLSPEQFRILRRGGTEPAFENAFWNNHEPGRYLCGACRNELFDSGDKFDSGTGWPSFKKPVRPTAVETKVDSTLGMVRTEVLCGRCGSHLGHVFEDGPPPEGLRYCMNSGALSFEPKQD